MAAPKKSSKKTTPQVMDVSKPGKTPPSSTSKPIIVGHGPRVGDPMVSDKTSGSSDDTGSEPVKIQVSRTSPKVIKPLTELDKKTEAPAPANEKEPEPSEEKPDTETDKPYVITVTNKPTEEKSAPELDPSAVSSPETNSEVDSEVEAQKVPQEGEGEESVDETNPEDSKPEVAAEATTEVSEQKPETDQDEPEAPDESSDTPEAENPDQITEPETKDSLSEEVPPEDESEDKPTESNDLAEQAAEETATVNAVASKTRDRSAESKQADEDRQRMEHIAQLIQNKKYFLPIKPSRKHRQKKNTLLIVLVLLLVTAGFMFAQGWLDISSIGLPGGLSGDEEKVEPAVIQPVEDDSSNQEDEPAADAEAEAKDTERKTDIDTIATNLDGYFAQFGNYPTLEQLNSEEFRNESLKSMPEESLKDPDGTELILVEAPTKNSYSYATLPENCDNDQLICASYTLTATLSDGETYQKQSKP